MPRQANREDQEIGSGLSNKSVPNSKLKSGEVTTLEQEKDSFWMWIGAVILAAVIGVFLLKIREMESVPTDGYEETRAQVEKQMSSSKK